LSQEQELRYFPAFIYKLLSPYPPLANLYLRSMSFWNYGTVAGIGVLINYAVWFAYVSLLPWFIVNAMAILTAWLWNWSMSVGPSVICGAFRKNLWKNRKTAKRLKTKWIDQVISRTSFVCH